MSLNILMTQLTHYISLYFLNCLFIFNLFWEMTWVSVLNELQKWGVDMRLVLCVFGSVYFSGLRGVLKMFVWFLCVFVCVCVLPPQWEQVSRYCCWFPCCLAFPYGFLVQLVLLRCLNCQKTITLTSFKDYEGKHDIYDYTKDWFRVTLSGLDFPFVCADCCCCS